MQQVLDAAQPDMLKLISAGKEKFVGTWGQFVSSAHLPLVNEIIDQCAAAKIKSLTTSGYEAVMWHDTYETCLERMSTVGLTVQIEQMSLMRATMKDALDQFLSSMAAGAGIVIKYGCALIPVPGAGIVGSIAGTGVEKALDYVFNV